MTAQGVRRWSGINSNAIPAPSILVTQIGFTLPDSEQDEAMTDSLEAQFQPVNDLSGPKVIEMFDEELQAYSFAPASEPKLTNPTEVQDPIRGLKVGKTPGPNIIPNRALKHLKQRGISLLVAIFKATLLAQYFPAVWKHSLITSILKLWKNPALPLSYCPISLLDTIGKLFEKILLNRILSEVSGRELLPDEQFGF
jgi:hypothetical protein